jgi:hypothetical protein
MHLRILTLVLAPRGNAPMGGCEPKDQDPAAGSGRDFRGQARRNHTHASRTAPDAKLYRRTHQGKRRLAYLGHLLIENRSGLVVDAMATQADGSAERDAAMLGPAVAGSGRTSPLDPTACPYNPLNGSHAGQRRWPV